MEINQMQQAMNKMKIIDDAILKYNDVLIQNYTQEQRMMIFGVLKEAALAYEMSFRNATENAIAQLLIFMQWNIEFKENILDIYTDVILSYAKTKDEIVFRGIINDLILSMHSIYRNNIICYYEQFVPNDILQIHKECKHLIATKEILS